MMNIRLSFDIQGVLCTFRSAFVSTYKCDWFPEVYSEQNSASWMVAFMKIVNGFQL